MKDTPLTVKIEDGELVIRVGVERLTACLRDDDGPCKGIQITDPTEFCEDIAWEMNRSNEVGWTPLSGFMDEMALAAQNNGSAYVKHNKKGRK